MRFTDIRPCFRSPGPSLGTALLALFLTLTRATALRERLSARHGRRDGLSGDALAPHAWPPARQVWQH